MRKIVEYKLVITSLENRFEESINNLIKEGFQPYGFVFLDFEKSECQAMVKYEEEYHNPIDELRKVRHLPPRPKPNPTRKII